MALTAAVAALVGDESGIVPAWSGRFVNLGGGVGVMMIHNVDTRTHQPPAGWSFAAEEPYVLVRQDAEVWYLVRTS